MRVPSLDEIMEVAQSRGALSDAPWLWDGLVGAWPTQEGSGARLIDVSGNRLHGVLVNMTPATDWQVSVTGRVLQFNGYSGKYVQIPNPNVISEGYTRAVWVRRDADVGTYPQVFTGNGFEGIYEQGDSIYIRIHINGARILDRGIATFTIGKWFFVAVTHDGTRFRCYVDGRQLYVQGSPGGPIDDLRQVNRLSNSSSNYTWDGLICRPLLYRRPLSSTEIESLYADPWAMYRLRRRIYAVPHIPAFIKRRSLGLRAGTREALI